MEDKSPFMLTKQVIARLNLGTYWDLERMSYSLLHMRFTTRMRMSRFYVRAYVEAYADWLEANNRKATSDSARAFASQPSSQQLIKKLLADIEKRFHAQRWVTRQHLCAFLGVTDKSIGNWYKAGALDAKDTRPGRVPGVYDAISLRRSLEWYCPTA